MILLYINRSNTTILLYINRSYTLILLYIHRTYTNVFFMTTSNVVQRLQPDIGISG